MPIVSSTHVFSNLASVVAMGKSMPKVGERRTKHRFCTTLRLLLVQEVTVSLLFCFQSALGPSPFHMFNNVFSDRSTNIPCCKPKYFISGQCFLKKVDLTGSVWIYLGVKQCQRLPSQLPQQSWGGQGSPGQRALRTWQWHIGFEWVQLSLMRCCMLVQI